MSEGAKHGADALPFAAELTTSSNCPRLNENIHAAFPKSGLADANLPEAALRSIGVL